MNSLVVENPLIPGLEFLMETEGEVGVLVVKSIVRVLLIGEGIGNCSCGGFPSRSFLLVCSHSSIAAISSSSLMSIFVYDRVPIEG